MINMLNRYNIRQLIKMAIEKKDATLELWEEWKKTRSPQALDALYKSVDKVIGVNINKWATMRIPQSALKVKAEKLALEAFEKYDPSRGASLATFVDRYLSKLYDYVLSNSQVMKVPIERLSNINRFHQAELDLREKYNRNPTDLEISEYLSIPLNEIKRFKQESFGILGEGPVERGFKTENINDATTQYALNIVYYDLDPDERKVYDYLYGKKKKEVVSTGEIARRTGFTDSKVSRIKARIAKKLEHYL